MVIFAQTTSPGYLVTSISMVIGHEKLSWLDQSLWPTASGFHATATVTKLFFSNPRLVLHSKYYMD